MIVLIICSVVQLVERRTVNARVAGSSPARAVKKDIHMLWMSFNFV